MVTMKWIHSFLLHNLHQIQLPCLQTQTAWSSGWSRHIILCTLHVATCTVPWNPNSLMLSISNILSANKRPIHQHFFPKNFREDIHHASFLVISVLWSFIHWQKRISVSEDHAAVPYQDAYSYGECGQCWYLTIGDVVIVHTNTPFDWFDPIYFSLSGIANCFRSLVARFKNALQKSWVMFP